MPILYGVVSHGSTILAKYASCSGNFGEVTEQIISRISPTTPRLTYSHGSYLFHYIYEDGLIYLCITDDDFDRNRAFVFLNDIKRRFQVTYGSSALTALPYAMNNEFSGVLAREMKHASDKDNDKISRVQGSLNELTGIMIENLESVAQRGEHLELLVDKAENLNDTSVSFRKASKNLARSMFWKNIKITVIIVLVIIILIYIIVSASCGGLSWPSCVN